MKKILSFLLLGLICSIGNLWAETESSGNAGANNTTLTGTSYSLDGKFIAGKGGVKQGNMPDKGVKLRSNQGNLVFAVSDGYKITGFSFYGCGNTTTAVVVESATVDGGSNLLASGVTMPAKGASASGDIILSDIEAEDNITLTFAEGSEAQIVGTWSITYVQTAVVTQEISAVTLNGAAISEFDLATLKSTNALTIDGSELNGLGGINVTLSSGATTVNKEFSENNVVYSFSLNSGADAYEITVSNVVRNYAAAQGTVVYYDSEALSDDSKTLTIDGVAFNYASKTFGSANNTAGVTLGSTTYKPIKLSTGEGVSVTFPTGKVATKIIVYGWSADGTGYMKTFKDGVDGENSIATSDNKFYATDAEGYIYPSVYEYAVSNWEALYFECAGGQPFVVVDFLLADAAPVQTYSVTYNANGGTGADVVEEVSALSACTFTAPAGKQFKEWNTAADGTGTSYAVGAAVTEALNLFAIWEDIPSETAYYLINAGVLNTTDFRGTFSLKDEDYTVSEEAYTKCVALGNTNSNMIGLYAQNKFVAYDSKTDVTDIDIVVWNKNSSDKNLVILVVPEGAEENACVPETISVTKSTGLVKSVHMTGRSTLYCCVSSTDVRFCQIAVSESGSILPMPGEVGYSVNHNKGRIAAEAGTECSLDGMIYNLSSGGKVLNTTESKIRTLGTNYIKFTAPEAIRLQVTTNNTAHFYVADSQNGTTNEIAPVANTASNIDLTAGTWYINPAGSDVKITNIAFVAVPAKYAVTFDLQGHGEAIDAQLLEAGAKVVAPATPEAAGFKFGGWYKEAECTNAWDFDVDVVSAATVLYAKWTAAYTVSYYNGATLLGTEQVISGESPVNAASYEALAHYTFQGWYSDAELTESATPASVVITAAKAFYGKYSITYSTSVDLGAEAYLNSKKTIETIMSDNNIVSTITTSNGGGYDTNDMYTGFKTKTQNEYFELLLQQGKQVIITFGFVKTGVTITVDGVVQDFETSTSALTRFSYTATSADAIIKVVNNSETKQTTTIRSIVIPEDYVLTTEDDDFYGLYLPWEVTIPSGIAAYTGLLSGSNLALTEVQGSVIPAATPVLVKSTEAGSFTFELSSTNAAAVSSSLRGIARETEVADIPAADKACLTLGIADGVVAFRKPAAASIAANKVYLLVDQEQSGAPVRIVMAEDNATAIDNIEDADNAVKFVENGVLYIRRNGVVYTTTGQVVR